MEQKIQRYKVGGAVRDKLLKQPVKDVDWVVVGADATILLAEGYQPVGVDFPVFLHPVTKEEYALARTERKSGKGYGGFTFYTSPEVTLEQDLARRDLTINAMAEDETGHIYDPYQGQQDLQNKLLRHVSPAFVEDPLRVLRVARFAARYAALGFKIAPETLALMTELSLSGELQELTAERVWKEFSRALMEQSPAVFLKVLEECQALSLLLPELADIQLVSEVLTYASNTDQPLIVRWAIVMLPLALANKSKAIKAINERFKVPADFADLALLTGQYLVTCQQSLSCSSEELLNLMQKVDVLRRPQRLKWLLTVVNLLAKVTGTVAEDEDYVPCVLLKEIAQAIIEIKPQSLIAKGFEGAALGEALTKQRLEKISQIKIAYKGYE